MLKSTLERPAVPRSAQEYIGVLRSALQRLGVPRSAQECPGGPRSAQDRQGAHRSAQECPVVPRSAQEGPRVPRSVQKCPRVPRSAQECPGMPRNAQEFPGVSWSAQDASAALRSAPRKGSTRRKVEVAHGKQEPRRSISGNIYVSFLDTPEPLIYLIFWCLSDLQDITTFVEAAIGASHDSPPANRPRVLGNEMLLSVVSACVTALASLVGRLESR